MVCRLHRIPCSIVLDRDAIFLSRFWCELFTLSGTILKRSTTYHSQTNGQYEVINRVLQQYLRCFTDEQPRKWYKFLHWAEYCYNVNFHSSLGMIPFKEVYDRDPHSILDYIPTPQPQLRWLIAYLHSDMSFYNSWKVIYSKLKRIWKRLLMVIEGNSNWMWVIWY